LKSLVEGEVARDEALLVIRGQANLAEVGPATLHDTHAETTPGERGPWTPHRPASYPLLVDEEANPPAALEDVQAPPADKALEGCGADERMTP
jgi:hypothetical protein